MAASAAAWRQREIGGGGSKAVPRHSGGAAAALRHYQWWQWRRWGRMTKAAAVMVCGGEKKLFTWRNRRLPSPTRINLEEPQVTQPNQE